MVFQDDAIVEIFPSIYRVKVTLPNNPLKFVNSYIIKGTDRSLLIDTAMNIESCYAELSTALDKLGIDRGRLDLFITHIHADHIGLADRFIRNSKIYMSNVEHDLVINAIENPDYWHSMNQYLLMNGMPPEILSGALKYLDQIYIKTYPSMREDFKKNFDYISDNAKLQYGDYTLKGILTPGHTPGHMCLYDEEHGILFSGDHVLFGITPNITWWPGFDDPLSHYIESLNKVKNLKIKITFPGHGEPGKNIQKRIEAIINHHNERFAEILDAMDNASKTAYEIASQIKWNLRYDAWESFPRTQKYFALGETIAHLIYLEGRNRVRSSKVNSKILYEKNEF